MASDQHELALPVAAPESWTRPKSKFMCRRDPSAGPGTCWYWWEGCPKAEKRNCYQRWFHERQRAPADEQQAAEPAR